MRLIDADKIKWRPTVSTMGLVIPEGQAFFVRKADIDDMPTVEADPIRHGKWIKIRYRTFLCSCCKRSVYLDGLNVTDQNENKLLRELYPYCHCGAKMEGKENELK